MNDISTFLIGLGITLAVSILVVAYLRRHVTKILIDLCQTEDRAAFWTAFSNVTLVLVPLICAMFHRPSIANDSPSFFEISTQLKWALIGLIGSVVILGLVIARFIPRQSQ